MLFMKDEVQRLLTEGIIKLSTSPWRAQFVVVKNSQCKKRLAIDYSQTVFRTIDLKSAFDAAGSLYQFTRMPFGVTNGIPCFQRKMDELIEEKLKDTFPYLDNVTICRRNQSEHDRNLKKFLAVAERKNLTYK